MNISSPLRALSLLVALSFALLLSAANTAAAQEPAPQDPVSMALPSLRAMGTRQLPTFLEVTGTTVGTASDAKFILHCGYSFQDGKPFPDSSLNDLAIMPTAATAYMRYENLDGRPVVSTVDPSGAQSDTAAQFIKTVVAQDGTIKAKSCQVVLEGDVMTACKTAVPFLTPAQAQTATFAVQSQCGVYLAQSAGQFSSAAFDAQKTADLKAKNHLDVGVLLQ